ncbi:MAG TPA: hypothetical protein VF452_23610, partial [Candidatus Binatia bacterium]
MLQRGTVWFGFFSQALACRNGSLFGLTIMVIYAIFPASFWPARGAFLIQKTKSHRIPADVLSGRERRIPLLHGSKDPFVCVSEALERVEENLARAIRSREQGL